MKYIEGYKLPLVKYFNYHLATWYAFEIDQCKINVFCHTLNETVKIIYQIHIIKIHNIYTHLITDFIVTPNQTLTNWILRIKSIILYEKHYHGVTHPWIAIFFC